MVSGELRTIEWEICETTPSKKSGTVNVSSNSGQSARKRHFLSQYAPIVIIVVDMTSI
jgi:hypothetical protein